MGKFHFLKMETETPEEKQRREQKMQIELYFTD